jgi:hypothetical protein
MNKPIAMSGTDSKGPFKTPMPNSGVGSQMKEMKLGRMPKNYLSERITPSMKN